MYPHTEFGIPTSNNMRYAPDIILLELNLEVNVTVTRKKYATLRCTFHRICSTNYTGCQQRNRWWQPAGNSEFAGDSRLSIATAKKYLNPHENSCSKVISILITGNIYHESSSAPQQHKSVQYKWFALYLHWDVSHTDMLQPHFISCRGVSGQEATCADPGIFVSFI